MLVEAVDFAVTVPVLIFVVSRKGAALMIDAVGPDILPAREAAVTGVSELDTLVAVVHIVVTPFVIRVGISAVLHVSEIFLAGDGSDTGDSVREVTHVILVGKLELETHVAVAVHVLD